MAGLNVKYYLQKVKKHHYIYVSVTWSYNRVRIPLPFRIEERGWDKKRQCIKSSYTGAADINQSLNNLKHQISNFHNIRIAIDGMEAPVSRDEVIAKVKLLIKPVENNKTKSLMEYFQQFIDDSKSGLRLTEQGEPIQFTTIKTYQTCKNHLEKFIKEKKYPLTFEKINEDFFALFIQYCIEKKLTNNSIGRQTKIIKSFMHYFENKDIHNNSVFIKSLKVYEQDTIQVSLSEQEICSIEKYKPTTDRLEKIKDLFLIQNYTGLRASDLFNLKPENIDLNSRTITLIIKKTKDNLIIPIEDKLISILKKHNCILPNYKDQKYNEGIKDLCKLAEIDTPVQVVKYIGKDRIEESKPKYELCSSHTARRSFITNLLKKGVMPEMVMAVSGHKNRRSFQKYVRVSKEESINQVREAMKS